jgi:hypothetical protein
MDVNQNSRNAYIKISVGPVKAQHLDRRAIHARRSIFLETPKSGEQRATPADNLEHAWGRRGNSTFLESSAMYNNLSNIYSIHTEIDRMPS